MTRKNSNMAVLTAVIGIALAGCQTLDNPGQLGLGLLGGATGGYGGSLVGKGRGKLAATAGGAVLGTLLGGFIGNRTIDTPRRNANQIQQIWAARQARRIHQQQAPAPVYQLPPRAVDRGGFYWRPTECMVIENRVRCGVQ